MDILLRCAPQNPSYWRRYASKKNLLKERNMQSEDLIKLSKPPALLGRLA